MGDGLLVYGDSDLFRCLWVYAILGDTDASVWADTFITLEGSRDAAVP